MTGLLSIVVGLAIVLADKAGLVSVQAACEVIAAVMVGVVVTFAALVAMHLLERREKPLDQK